jgi:hypothetical protein
VGVTDTGPSPQLLELAYRFEKISWAISYHLVIGSRADFVNFSATLTIANETACPFRAAQLVIGDATGSSSLASASSTSSSSAYARAGWMKSKKAFSHGRHQSKSKFARSTSAPGATYPLAGTHTIPARGSVSLALFALDHIPASRTHVFEPCTHRHGDVGTGPSKDALGSEFGGGCSARSPSTFQTFEFSPPNGVGTRPGQTLAPMLPGGPLRITRLAFWDAGEVRFAEVQVAPQLAAFACGDTVPLLLGELNNVTCEKRRLQYKRDNQAKTIVERFRIVIRNRTARDHEIIVREPAFRTKHFKFFDISHEHEIEDEVITFVHTARAKTRSTISFGIKYRWGVKSAKDQDGVDAED